MPYWGVAMMPDEWPEVPPDSWPSDAETDVFLDYPDDDSLVNEGYWPIDLPDPSGMSGGGIWDEGHGLDPIWSPESVKLFAIQSGWYEKKRYVRGVQIIHWLRLIHEHYRDLRPLLEEQFPVLQCRGV